MITAYLRADRATLVRMRRVCRAWLAWFTKCDVEVHIKWPERSTPNPIHLPALRASVASFGGLTGLSLANHTLVPETFDIIGELVGPRLRHLSFAIHAEARPSAKHDRLAPFTNLETLTIRSRNNLNLIIPSLSKCTVMPRLHSLSLTELYFSSSAKFGNSCSFPSLTSLSLEPFSVPDLTGTSFYTQLLPLPCSVPGRRTLDRHPACGASTPRGDYRVSELLPQCPLCRLLWCYCTCPGEHAATQRSVGAFS